MMFAVLMAIAAFPSMYWITNHFVDRPLAIEWFPIFAVNLTLFCVMMAVESNQVTLYSHHRDDLILKLSLLNITGLLILNVIFIPLFELWGAACVLLFMACMIFTVQHMFIRNVLKHKKGSRLIQYFLCPLMMLMPNRVKIFLYNKLFGWEIDKTAKIGLSYLHVEKAKMGANTRIGHLNIIKNLERFEMGECSTLGNMNVVSALPLGSEIHFKHEEGRVQALIMGKHTDIVKNIFLDCNNKITIGDYTIIAGAGTSFFTHSINIERNRQESGPITLGSHSMVGADSVLTRGAVLPDCSVLAANSTLHKAFDQTHMLYSGVPAKPVKELNPEGLFFKRKVGFVD
jgi:acetyltransferase-like isoleucine patch superfamily enzyme